MTRAQTPSGWSVTSAVRRGHSRRAAPAALLAALGLLAIALPSAAQAEPKLYECQKPVTTGVEVFGLRNISKARACAPALALYKWEGASNAHVNALYGCRRKSPDEGGIPYLRLRSFQGYRLSLTPQPYGAFTMSRGRSSFHVGGTDFPINCS